MTILNHVDTRSALGRDDEASLVAGARAGNADALRQIMQAHNQRLYRVARAILRDDSEAEDAVQEAYLLAFRNLDRFRGDSRLSTWLTRIAANEALARVRRKNPLAGSEDWQSMDDRRVIPFPGQPGQADPETDLGRTQVRVILQRVIDRLPVSFRMVFVLRDIEELSSEEVADHLGLNAETVRTRLFRARRLLQQALRHEFSAGMGDLFPFNGPRCERLTDRVLAALTEQA